MIITSIALSVFISAQIQAIDYLRHYDSRPRLNSSQKKIVSEKFPRIAETIPSKSNPWAEIDPLDVRTLSEKREARRLAFIEALDPFTIDERDQDDTLKNAFRILLENRFPGSSILTGAKIAKISTQYTERYESNVADIALIRNNLLNLVAELGAQWSICGGEKLYFYNGTILMASFESGRIRLFPTNIDMPIPIQQQVK